MKRVMVKKRLADGRICDKCIQAEALLKARGLWEQIDEVIWAEEGQPASEGMVLAATLGVKVAPFFLRIDETGEKKVYTSALQFIREVLTPVATEVADATAVSDAPVNEPLQLEESRKALEGQPPMVLLKWCLQQFGRDCAIAFSGAEDVVLLDMAVKTGLPFSVFCLDTGRLHPETYRFIEDVRSHYDLDLQLFTPDPNLLQPFVREKGLFSFLRDGHKECCAIRKVEPLKRALSEFRAWISGQRRDQSPGTRDDLLILQEDPAFTGKDGAPLVKMNPLAEWTSAQVWGYIQAHDVPFNPLHQRGFISIGCEPCTRAILPNEHERAGRWWWEEATQRECGLHLPKEAKKAMG